MREGINRGTIRTDHSDSATSEIRRAIRRRLLVGLGLLPGLEAALTYGGGVTGPASYGVGDVAWTVAALRAGLESFNGV